MKIFSDFANCSLKNIERKQGYGQSPEIIFRMKILGEMDHIISPSIAHPGVGQPGDAHGKIIKATFLFGGSGRSRKTGI